MKELKGPIPLPCPILELEIGNAIEQIELARSNTEKQQWEHVLASLESKYESQCGGKVKRTRTQLTGPRGSIRLNGKDAFLNLVNEHGNVVSVIFGGNDGILVTIDGAGHIHVLPPEGPGDPEVRQAVTSIIAAVKVLNRAATAAGAGA